MHKVVSTLLTVVVAIGSSALIWVGANLVFNQVRRQWTRFTAMAAAAIGAVTGILFAGNRVTVGSQGGFLHWVWLPAALAAMFAAIGVIIDATEQPAQRLAAGAGAGVLVGGGVGVLVRDAVRPNVDVAALIAWTAATAAVLAGLNVLRHRSPVTGAVVGAAVGSIIGGWGSADIGAGSSTAAIVATIVPAVLVGVRLGLTTRPDAPARARIDHRSRAVIFLAPAMLFVFVGLVVPAVRTIYLSVLDRRSDKFVGLENYGATFTDRVSWDTSEWTNIFTSKLFVFGVIALGLALVIGIVSKRRTGRAVELGNPTVGPLLVGALLVAFAVFTTLRGTIVNNLWWVTTVVFVATAMGLAIAVLADNTRSEKVAKAFIFLPLAVSLVGASVIWRFMYVPRDNTSLQTGTLNGLWVGLGRLSTGSGIPTILVGAAIGLALLALLIPIGRAVVRRRPTRAVVPAIVFALLAWFFVRYTAIVGDGVGGFSINSNGKVVAKAISFIQESPFNNFWLMVILIWIQTGFAMVILSAAIKAVPDELLEAARVDGGSPSQIFWRITLPQISTTIGVVVTTLIVLVMKVFDIVKVVTNGNFGTQVLANDMYNQAFNNTNYGRGAALATILFLSVLPVMYFNIRRMQRDT